MSLLSNPAIQPALVRCRMERLQRLTEEGPQASRFQAVMDDYDDELGHVSGRFKMIQTADVLAALDLVAERHDIQLAPRGAFYRNGRAKVELELPNRTINTDDRDGGITPMLYIVHGLGGRAGLKVISGANIRVCSNGLIMGTVVNVDYARHTESLNIEALVVSSLSSLDENIDKNYRLITAAKREAFDYSSDLMREIGESAPKRLRPTFKDIIRDNRSTYGDTVWSLIQSTTELATHHMRARQDSTHVWSADDWSQRTVANISRAYELAPA